MGADRPPAANEPPEGDAADGAGEPAGEVVDFDALHAALGELTPTPGGSSPLISESQGRANATYSSSRPHAIPSTRPPAVDIDAPPVIVADDEDTIPNTPTPP